MTVFDNLENYEIPSGYRLSLEQEDELSKIVSDIITELDKRKASKLETRKYFKRCLRYSTNVAEDNAEKCKEEDRYEEGESYTPLKGEYTWTSNLLQPVLLSVLKVEKEKYGYIVNLLLDDLATRGIENVEGMWKMSDGVIQFSQQFDFNDIKAEVEKMDDIRKRIVFLNTKKAEVETSAMLSYYERQEWIPNFQAQIDALIRLEEKRLELYPQGRVGAALSLPADSEPHPSVETFEKAHKYEFNFELAHLQLLQLMSRVADDPSTAISADAFKETFEIVDNEFSKYIEGIDLYEEDSIEMIFLCVDHWFDNFKEFADSVYCDCEKSIRPASRKKKDTEAAKIKEKKAHNLSMFILERAIWNVTGYKADIMYNHRYVQQVYYNINGWSFDDLVAIMEQMEDKFGKGKERAILFDRDANITAFYEEMVDVVRRAFIELSHESDTMSDDERLETFKAWISGIFESELPMYIDLAKREEDISTSIYHEAEAWVQTTIYCLTQVFMAAEMRIAQDEEMSELIDYGYFQDTATELLSKLKDEAIAEFKSSTGDLSIDNRMNELGEIDADERELTIPPFDESLLGQDFITEEDLGLREVDERQPELNGEVAQDISGNAPLIAIISENDLPEKKTERESLLAHILLPDKKEAVVAYLKEHLDSNRPTDSVALLVAARELGITDFIPQADAEKLFGNIASRSTFNTYYRGSRDVSKTSKDAYKQALTLQFLSTKSGKE